MLRDEIARLVAQGDSEAIDALTVMVAAARNPSPATWPGVLPASASGDTDAQDDGAELVVPTARAAGDRYQELGSLGVGGMGDVRRVLDRDLGRTLAMKVLRSELVDRQRSVARFIEEAQATSQLQHPGIVPVHELGRLADGRWYYTMQEVRGRTLGAVLEELHDAASRAGAWTQSRTGWSLRLVVDAFHQVCQAVAYAHERGVIHRDLKPENILLGAHGVVQVVDWGLAKLVGRPDPAVLEGVSTDRSRSGEHATRVGSVTGTPAYMPPEQASGHLDSLGPRTDVYALGAVLYEILTGGPPYEGYGWSEIVRAVRTGPPVPVREHAWMELPTELVEACERAMQRDPAARFASADALAAAIQAWLDGSRKREQALRVVEEAEARLPEAARLREEAASLRRWADHLADEVEPWQPEESKHPMWDVEERAGKLAREARLHELEHEQLLNGALIHAPDLVEGHASLAEVHLERHRAAEAARSRDDVARAEVRLRRHLAGLPDDHPVHTRATAYLKGDGALTLVTVPPGAEVLLHHYEERHRRLRPRFLRSLGRTPITELSLEQGSYLCILRREGHADVRYPVFIGRQEHWHGCAPGEAEPHPIWLPPSSELGKHEAYVPAGWFWAGGDPVAPRSLARTRLWGGGFVLERHPVTNRRYLAFLDDLAAQGREDDALRFAPRERSSEGVDGAMIVGRAADGRFVLRPDADGDVWLEEYPVCMVDWHCAVAFARWTAARTSRAWRLPGDLEWEQAARGADGRLFPWGDGFDPTWCNMAGSTSGRPLPAAVDSFPVDASPYGVQGLAGNMRDWCGEVPRPEGQGPRDASPERASERVDAGLPAGTRRVRGGAWYFTPGPCRSAMRDWSSEVNRGPDCGIRLLRRPAPLLGS